MPVILMTSFFQLRLAPVLVSILLLIGVWTVIQLISLPPSIWQALPARQLLTGLDGVAVSQDAWRPISWAPFRGLNALFGLLVPLLSLLLALATRAQPRMILLLIAGIGLLDALVGFLQLLSGPTSPLYLYAITNRGASVGVFANENHSAVFSAIVLLVLAWLFSASSRSTDQPWLGYFYPAAFVIVLLSALVSGSRGGLVLALLAATVSSILLILRTSNSQSSKRRNSVVLWLEGHPVATALSPIAFILFLVSTFIGFERSRAFEDILAQNAFEDLRWSLWPVLKEMMADHWIVGTGFGSFEQVYNIYEPTNLLMPSYVNQAHNDWAQLVIEGGLPAVALLLALLGWIGVTLYKILRQKEGVVRFLFWSSCFLIIGAASVVDYPLRTPIFQLCAVWLLLAMHLERLEYQPSE
ncbi:MAG: O-antigen ligase family protein [Sphingomonadaceae bacterium]|nr:O-antigen ligase family protein [Sphingomonadaceae bacterium]